VEVRVREELDAIRRLGPHGLRPETVDDYWIARFAERFGPAAGKDAFLALKYASKIIPTVTSFHWNYMNGDWYPEGNVGGWNTSDGMKKPNFREDGIFHDIREWIFNNVIDDSLINIPDCMALLVRDDRVRQGTASPGLVASAISNVADESERYAHSAAAKIEEGKQRVGSARNSILRHPTALGHYYACKIWAAHDLMAYLFTTTDAQRSEPVILLEKAAITGSVLLKSPSPTT